ncbi:MAG TPA: SRPBCC family protein [Candidatus Limnocylindrales bacterium]
MTTLSDTEIRLTREIDAPRQLVWDAHTQAEHLKHWYGRGNPVDVELDFRVGGKYRFVEHADGETYAFRGEYREISEPEKFVQTFEFEGMPGHILVETVEFTDQGGKTLVTSTSVFDNVEDRDGMLESGMVDGAEQSYQALDRYLKTMP